MGRGLSADEKRVKLLEIFHETKDFYQLKELEKLAPKMKGIVSQSVKEVLQSLVDDGLVQSDKVGSSNFFWSFPSQRGAAITAKVNAGRALRKNGLASLSELKNLTEQERVLRPETADRREALASLASKKKEIAELQGEMIQYGACDPTQVEAKRRAIFLAHEAAVRWTDNFSLMRTHFLKQTGADWASLQIYLGICDTDEYESIA
ncbi:meiotic nuclear division protein 1 [Gautieria morchelliformis]|nr:meiotic nuclear division protein 1 [Gautieria morchelliformis]